MPVTTHHDAMTTPLQPGAPAPWFHAAALGGNPRYAFNTAGGRWIMLLFLGSGATDHGAAALALLDANRALFDDDRACFFGVTMDPRDAAEGRIARRLPGIRWFLDYDGSVATAYGALRKQGDQRRYRPCWLLIDPQMRVHSATPIDRGAALLDTLRAILGRPQGESIAPVLVVPDILSPDLRDRLIATYDAAGGEDSGFMREEAGVTVLRLDHGHKRRRDHVITDQGLLADLRTRLNVALRPMMQRAFQFDPTRIERFLIACYDAREGGHFRPHRDNTTAGTAHRRFACTINLNSDYDGGDLRFPEYGPRTYRAPPGGAVVFSCSLLHEATPVTRGRRYAFLPFFYDEAAALLRERNMPHVAPEIAGYRSGLSDSVREG